ncbi:hypothetical protein TNCV_4892541 [Trichonephila clavipes]|nr:hypothetical protein TNCV_4892541 [Trichonephila clavipes]
MQEQHSKFKQISFARVSKGNDDCSRGGVRKTNRHSAGLQAAFTPRQSAWRVERLANQRLHLARDKVSEWLDA